MQVISHHKNYFVEFGTNTLTYLKSKLPESVVSRMHTPSLAQSLSQRIVLIAAIIGTTAAIILIANHFFKNTNEDRATPSSRPNSDRPASSPTTSPTPSFATPEQQTEREEEQLGSGTITPRSFNGQEGSAPASPRSNVSAHSQSSHEEGKEEVGTPTSDRSAGSRSSRSSSTGTDNRSMEADADTHGEGLPAAQHPILRAMPPAETDPHDLSLRRAGTMATVVVAFAIALFRGH